MTKLWVIAFAYAIATSCSGVQRGPLGPPALQTDLRPGGFELVVTNWRGEGKELPGLHPAWQYNEPALSPDGKRLALTARPPGAGTFPPSIESQIVIYTLPSGPAVRLEGPGQNNFPAWVGNTGKVSFARWSGRDALTSSLIVRNADGSGQEQELLNNIMGLVTGVAWFGDGQRFLLTNRAPRADQPSVLRIYSVTDLGRPRILLSNNLLPSSPVLNRDETVVALTAAAPLTGRGANRPSQRGGVYVMSVNGGPTQTVSSTGENPTWSSNGSTLFFMTTDTRVISSARVQTRAPQRPQHPFRDRPHLNSRRIRLQYYRATRFSLRGDDV